MIGRSRPQNPSYWENLRRIAFVASHIVIFSTALGVNATMNSKIRIGLAQILCAKIREAGGGGAFGVVAGGGEGSSLCLDLLTRASSNDANRKPLQCDTAETCARLLHEGGNPPTST